jgi:hypothetical protein
MVTSSVNGYYVKGTEERKGRAEKSLGVEED